MEYFEIHGGKKLHGEITVNTAKNSAVALLMASLINKGKTTLKNVPQIEEVFRLVEVLKSIGVTIEQNKKDIIIIPPKKFRLDTIDKKSAQKTRSIVMLLGAIFGHVSRYVIPQSGGCRLGKRTIQPHLYALEEFGLAIEDTRTELKVKTKKRQPGTVILYESGDTVTENALFAAAQTSGATQIRYASSNYMVQDVCFFLEKLGVTIEGIGTSVLTVCGQEKIDKDVTYELSEDPIEAMFFLSLAITTQSKLRINRCPIEFLELELLKLAKMGFEYKILDRYKAKNTHTTLVDIQTYPSKLKALEEKIHPHIYPGINIDNLPFFVPVALQAKGKTLIHDWVYENRAVYFLELNRLGGNVSLMDPHRVLIEGPTKLMPTEMICPPALRPSAIILVGMIAAKGISKLHGVYAIQRGYEKLEERLRDIGVEIALKHTENLA